MPKPMLKPLQQSQTTEESILSAAYKAETKKENRELNRLQLDRILRKQRSKEYMSMMGKLDAGGHVHNQDKVNDMIQTIRNEFPEVEIQGILLGIVSICYLGEPYEVHTLDVKGRIVEHYKQGQSLPDGMEKARSIAIRGGYEVLEVYTDRCCAVSMSGMVSVIPC